MSVRRLTDRRDRPPERPDRLASAPNRAGKKIGRIIPATAKLMGNYARVALSNSLSIASSVRSNFWEVVGAISVAAYGRGPFVPRPSSGPRRIAETQEVD